MYILHIKIVLNNNLYHTAFRKVEDPAERRAVESSHLPIKCLFKFFKVIKDWLSF